MVETKERPTLPPMLRTRFWRPVAFPICSLRNVPIASVVKGTKMQGDAETGDDIGHDDVATWLICKSNRLN